MIDTIRTPLSLTSLIASAVLLSACGHRVAVLSPQPPSHTIAPKPYKPPVRKTARPLDKYLKENAQRNARLAKDADRHGELQEWAKDVGEAGKSIPQPTS